MKNTKPKDQPTLSPNNGLGPQASAKRIAKNMPRPKDAILVRKLEVKPSEQIGTRLGSFTVQGEPKGFLIEMDPDPSPLDSVVAEITSQRSGTRSNFHLHIANSSSRAVHAEVWRL